MKKDLAQSQEKLSRYITTIHRIFATLHNLISKLQEGRDEILLQSLHAAQAEVQRVMDTSLSLSDREADATLLNQLTALQKEKQATLLIIRELRPGMITKTTTNGLFSLNMDALKDVLKLIRQTAWELRTLQISIFGKVNPSEQEVQKTTAQLVTLREDAERLDESI